MATNTTLHIPNDLVDVHLAVNDTLSIEVMQTCTWCYSDPDGVFSSMLAAGTYTATTPPTTYGPYTAVKTGTVAYNAVTSGDCVPGAGITATMHSITVS